VCDVYKLDPNVKIPKEALDAIEKEMQRPLAIAPLKPEEMYPRFVLVPQTDFDRMTKELAQLKALQIPSAVSNLSREVENLKTLNAKYQERAVTAEAELEYLGWHPMTEKPKPWEDIIIRDEMHRKYIGYHTGEDWATGVKNPVAWCRAKKEST